jgi:hypothetical protein
VVCRTVSHTGPSVPEWTVQDAACLFESLSIVSVSCALSCRFALVWVTPPFTLYLPLRMGCCVCVFCYGELVGLLKVNRSLVVQQVQVQSGEGRPMTALQYKMPNAPPHRKEVCHERPKSKDDTVLLAAQPVSHLLQLCCLQVPELRRLVKVKRRLF